MYNSYIWDFDGTLFDTYGSLKIKHIMLLKKYGIEEDMDYIMCMLKNQSSREVFKYYNEQYNIDIDTIIKEDLEFENNIEILGAVKPFDGAKKVCEYIVSKGYKNYIITHKGKSLNKILDNYNMTYLFSDIITPYHGYKRKPNPEMFNTLIKKEKLEISKTLSIGDRDYDIIASKRAGLDTCYFKPNLDKKIEQSTFIINEMKEMYNIINKK